MREGFENWLIVCSVIFVLGIITYFAIPERKTDDAEDVMGIETVQYKHVPYIISVAPIHLEVGESFEYIVEVSDLDTPYEEISISLTGGPDWMYIDGDTVLGEPLEAGTYKYEITVSDGTNTSSKINYVLVEENE